MTDLFLVAVKLVGVVAAAVVVAVAVAAGDVGILPFVSSVYIFVCNCRRDCVSLIGQS